MFFTKVTGIVIQSKVYKESDRLIHILTPDLGVVVACVPRASKSNSALGALAQPLAVGEFVLTKYHDFYYLKEGLMKTSFRRLQEDIEKLTLAAHVLEITLDISIDPYISSSLFYLLIQTLVQLENIKKNPLFIVGVFQWKISQILGFTAYLDACVCKEKDPDRYGYFSIDKCCLLCIQPSCLGFSKNNLKVQWGTLLGLRYIYDTAIEKVFSFALEPELEQELFWVSKKYLEHHMEKSYTKLELLAGW